jgi:formylglycine-generating enzyme required for sulfatase activity
VYFTLLAGQPPFADAGNPIDVYDAVLHRPVPTVRTGAPEIPLRCDAIVGRAMAKDPIGRYPSVDAMVSELDTLLAADDTPRPAPLPKIPRRPTAWQRAPTVLAGLVLAAGLAAAAWWVFGSITSPPPATPSTRTPAPGLPTELNSIGMVLARVPAGKYVMGDRLIADNQPHLVQISRPFLIGVHEVTQAHYKIVVGANPSHFTDDGRPVDSVTWADAVEFCTRLSARSPEKAAGRVYRLPTEAEWEYACRAGTRTAFSLGETLPPETANSLHSGFKATVLTGTFPPNPWGLYDVHGNVWEWCSDWYDPTYSDAIDPAGPESGFKRVTRGGSWQASAAECRSGFRNDAFAPDVASPAVGFRVVCVVGEKVN